MDRQASHEKHSNSDITQFVNCSIIRDDAIIQEDLWLRAGKIINPEPVFYGERVQADVRVDCGGSLIAPGFIDLQINGGFGYDFSDNAVSPSAALDAVAKGVLKHGVTSFCPTLVTQTPASYAKILPQLRRRRGGRGLGATVLGVHLEGPFISREKRGAHQLEHVREEAVLNAEQLLECYGSMDDVALVTIAPEVVGGEVIRHLSNMGVVVSIGHSMSELKGGVEAVRSGAKFITHLFNAMLPFHHRDPGLVGLLTAAEVSHLPVYYGIIVDGIHTHDAALSIAYRANREGCVLVTDAISAMGLPSGSQHKMGDQLIEIRDGRALVAGTNTLCGSIANMDQCVRNLRKVTRCSTVEAVNCGTLHPAKVLGIANRKGTLRFGADADFVLLDDELKVRSTWIAGECVWENV